MKTNACIIILSALLITGCAASNKNQSNRLLCPESVLCLESGVLPLPNAPPTDDDFNQLENELDEQEVKVSDPLKPLNRAMFHFNDKLYFWVLKPCARACKKTLPEPARISVRNFFNNLTTPVRFVSCHLQGKHKSAGTELHRFAYNTTFGVLGFGDPAKDKLGLEMTDEDLGQTLGKWGAGTGVYIVLPLFGPSNVRDTVGLVGDQFLNPVRYVDPTEASFVISAFKYTNDYTFRLGEYESFKKAAYDPYIAMRRAYIQYRDKEVQK